MKKKRVHFIGYVGGQDKSMAYHASEFLVIPSRQEAMSIVVLESGIAGKPVLLTDQCGFDEIDRIDGGKVVSATVKGLENGLCEMIDSSQNLQIKGENLKAHINKRYLWNVIVRDYLKLYREIIEERNKGHRWKKS